jgi:predicted PurR-regulated permease PerM
MTETSAPAPARDQAAPPPAPEADRGPAWARPGAATWFRAGFFLGLGLIVAWTVSQAVYTVRDVLVRVLVAVFLAVSLDPAVRWLVGRNIRRGLAVLVIFVVFIGIIAGFLFSVIPPLVNQFDRLIQDTPGYVASLQQQSGRFRDLNERFDLSSRLEGLTRTLPATITGGVLGFTKAVFGALANTITVIVFMIYFMLDMPRLRRNAARLVPVPRRARFQRVLDLVVDKVGAYMIGQLLTAFVAGVCAFVAMTVLGVQFPIPLAILVSFTALIPLIGASLGAVVAVLVTILTTGLWPAAVLLLGFFLVYQQVENYFIAPRIQRSAVDLSAAAVLLAGLLGATALGLLGALMAIPVAAAVKVVVREQMEQHEQATLAA